MVKLELEPKSFRRARTRTLIQLGGLIEKAGLLEEFGLHLGSDLQKDSEMKDPVFAFYGALLELKNTISEGDASLTLWKTKGAKMLGENAALQEEKTS